MQCDVKSELLKGLEAFLLPNAKILNWSFKILYEFT